MCGGARGSSAATGLGFMNDRKRVKGEDEVIVSVMSDSQ